MKAKRERMMRWEWKLRGTVYGGDENESKEGKYGGDENESLWVLYGGDENESLEGPYGWDENESLKGQYMEEMRMKAERNST